MSEPPCGGERCPISPLHLARRRRRPQPRPPPLRCSVEQFFQQCDPTRENLCLYGEPDGTWNVDLPAEEVPPELPEPALGINFARDGMQVRVWGVGGSPTGVPRCTLGAQQGCLPACLPVCWLAAHSRPPPCAVSCLGCPPAPMAGGWLREGVSRNSAAAPTPTGPPALPPLLQRRDWLALVAVHSDSWLLALSFYKGAQLGKGQR